MLKELTVLSATASTGIDPITNKPVLPGFVVKLQTKEDKSVVTAFGTKTSATQETYYMKLDTAPAVGFKAPLEMDDFKVVERPYTITEGPDAGTTIMLKWLHIK